MSFVLKTYIDEEISYFRGWIADNRNRPAFDSEIKNARHWKQRAICKRFIDRNTSTLILYGITKPHRIIEDRYCLNCNKLLDPNMKKSAKHCDDHCRLECFNRNKL
jgi:hypothetical protein